MSSDNFRIRDAGASRLNIAGNGDISFYEDTGTTPKFFWDASAESLGIGTTSPIGKLDVSDGTNPLSIDSSTYNEIQSYNRPLLLNRQGNNVGIGTSSPSEKLDVSGNVRLVGSYPYLQILRTSDFYYGKVSADGFAAFTNTNGSAPVIFKTASTERMRIDSSGNVGIGTTGPTEKLHVSGNILATGDVTAFSDERLKTEIETISEAVDKVKQLRGVTFQKDGRDSLGVIAQEVQKVLPEVVHESGDYLSVAYGNIVGLLIEAVKEQQVQIDELKARTEEG